MSVWAVVPSSSAWPLSSSARPCSAASSTIFALKLVSVSLGAIIYYIVIQLVLPLGFDANLLKLLSASVVAVFLAVPYWKSKYFAKPAAKKRHRRRMQKCLRSRMFQDLQRRYRQRENGPETVLN